MTNIFKIEQFATSTAATKAAPAEIQLLETAAGQWSVRDAGDTKGGLFYTAKAALRFIADEFGDNAQINTVPATAMAA